MIADGCLCVVEQARGKENQTQSTQCRIVVFTLRNVILSFTNRSNKVTMEKEITVEVVARAKGRSNQLVCKCQRRKSLKLTKRMDANDNLLVLNCLIYTHGSYYIIMP